MNIAFISGHEPNFEQKRRILEVLGLVENEAGGLEAPGNQAGLLPNINALLSRVSPSVWKIGFFDPSELGSQTPFALTFFEEHEAITKIRNDAPGFGSLDESLREEAASWGLEYDPERHLNETIVHEMGHALFDGLSEATQLMIVEMFGGDTLDPSVIYDPGLEWEDRIGEGIADTFKEAFLPAEYRVFPNRTRRRIPYHQYPRFRAFFVHRRFSDHSYLYGSAINRVPNTAEHGIRDPVHFSKQDGTAFVVYDEIKGLEECWGVFMEQFPEAGHLPFSIARGPCEGETT